MIEQSKHSKYLQQLTIRKEVRINGVGLHSGKAASILIKPALPNTGILFIRKDLPTSVAIPASFEFVTQTKLATTLGRNHVTISTVEHLLSAFKLMEIDNALVEVFGPEVPIMDGSAAAFCEMIAGAGVFEQEAPKKVAIVKKRIEVRMGDKVALIEPSERLQIKARIEWNHPSIGVQEFSYTLGESDFRSIAMARTFGFMKDVENLKKMGLVQGGSLDNAIVLDEARIINKGGLRYPNEFVRHKVLDAIGDFALAPMPILGDVTLVKAGHELHSELVHAIFSNPENYEVKTLAEISNHKETPESRISTPWLAASLQGTY